MRSHKGADSCSPLVSTVAPRPHSPGPKQNWLSRQQVFPRSKGAFLILVWNMLVGTNNAVIIRVASVLPFWQEKPNTNPTHILYGVLAVYMLLAAIQLLFYPLGGLIADIYCGRYKVIAFSTVIICLGYFLLLVPAILLATDEISFPRPKDEMLLSCYATLGVAFILFVFIGSTGFKANAVQFGLDQLMDAPSQDLSTFLHWFHWTEAVGRVVMGTIIMLLACYNQIMFKMVVYAPIAFIAVITAILVLSCFKRQWFHSEPHTHNPYGTVYRVLKFVARHKRYIRRSAFTFCDDEKPTRIEFAKQRFGGPFATETVEDVKTFLRILVMLLAIGPVYVVSMAVTHLFPLYGVHVGPTNTLSHSRNESCNYFDWIMLQSGNLTHFVSVVLIPPYIIFILPCVRKYYPKILFRLGTGMGLLLLAAISMTVTQLVAHYTLNTDTPTANISCLFDAKYFQHTSFPTLDLPSWVLVFPNILCGVALPLINIAVLEFISAQSPHTMKGLLLGTLYAVQGLYTILGSVMVFPFANGLWKGQQGHLFDCGVSYYTAVVLFGVAVLVLFGLAARWYRYRERDDLPYGPRYVEAYYQRCIERRQVEMADSQEDTSYGTMAGF